MVTVFVLLKLLLMHKDKKFLLSKGNSGSCPQVRPPRIVFIYFGPPRTFWVALQSPPHLEQG